MSSPTTREPSTKFYGPNYPFVIAAVGQEVHVQLHNLQPGQHWNPIFEGVLLSKHILLPAIGQKKWQVIDFPFGFEWIHQVDLVRLRVVFLLNGSEVFIFSIQFAITKWMMNELLEPAGNFAFGGSATLAWKGVQRQ